jgi:hypothetical protein
VGSSGWCSLSLSKELGDPAGWTAVRQVPPPVASHRLLALALALARGERN